MVLGNGEAPYMHSEAHAKLDALLSLVTSMQKNEKTKNFCPTRGSVFPSFNMGNITTTWLKVETG